MTPRKVVVLALVTVGVLGFAPAAPAQITGDVTGTVKKGDKTGTFKGTFTPEVFRVVDDKLVAVGTLAGRIDLDGKTKEVKNARVSLPVDLDNSGVGLTSPVSARVAAPGAAGPASGGCGCAGASALDCNVLNLVLGPLDLNLLGLEVHLNQVILDIVANPAGGLLGSLLSILCGLNLTTLLGQLLGSLPLLSTLLNLLMVLGGLGL